ncbi:hypothetical protein HGRIS_007223 [Hohenbuehelia grisea]|uniref:Pyranose 2-oxidase n=1 Tax=Hohenbuehelia grisea TaxID=104357 RepID=A0ABR3JD34_9AGAR
MLASLAPDYRYTSCRHGTNPTLKAEFKFMFKHPSRLRFLSSAAITASSYHYSTMASRLSEEDIQKILLSAKNSSTQTATANVIFTDVFIAGSGPVACAYARTILDQKSDTKVFMAELGSQDSKIPGEHHKNSIKYQKDIDSFVNVIKGALQPISVPPSATYLPTLGGEGWTPSEGSHLTIQGHNPHQVPEKNLQASAVTRTVGGMATHWTCACPIPHEEERVNNPIPKAELDSLLDRAKDLLNVHLHEYDHSIRHQVVKSILQGYLPDRHVDGLPLAVERRKDNPQFVTWTGSNTVLGAQAKNPNFTLSPETRVTRLCTLNDEPGRISGALLRELNTDKDVIVIAKTFIIACGAVSTPQILANSRINLPPALGHYLAEQSLAFCQIVLKREYIESIAKNPNFAAAVKKHLDRHPKDPLPIPFDDPEPQVIIPYTSKFKYHCQVHRDAFSYGDVGPKADPRLIVDIRFFGKQDINKDNSVTFPRPQPEEFTDWKAGDTDIYGMPQATFEVRRSKDDDIRDQKMMKDMTDIASQLGSFLPGSYPQFMEPGLALHITGTTRIGKDAATSVANAESLVHGFTNLWVGGNGCIPDSTACNPTRTSIAIAIKGAEAVLDFLKKQH